MGYRNYLCLLEKDKLKDLDADIKKFTKTVDYGSGPETYLETHDLMDTYCKEVFELGKYSDEGSVLEQMEDKLPEDIDKDKFNKLAELLHDNEYGFNYVSKRRFELLVDSYRNRVVMYFEGLFYGLLGESTAVTKEEASNKVLSDIRQKLEYAKRGTIINMNPQNKSAVSDAWLYEYEIFNLVHIYKTMDWDKYIMVITGW